MKFKYDIKNNFYKMYGEANYLVAYKKKYMNSSNKKIKNYFSHDINRLILLFLLYIISLVIESLNFWTRPILFTIFIMFIFFFINFSSLRKYIKSNHKGEIIIDENGITDNSDINITFPWEKVELIGLTKNMMAIVLDSPFVIILKPNKKIISEIRKYKDVKVIENK